MFVRFSLKSMVGSVLVLIQFRIFINWNNFKEGFNWLYLVRWW